MVVEAARDAEGRRVSRPAGGPAPTPRWVADPAVLSALRDVSHPPEGLWVLGDAAALVGAPHRHVAIVGTREATPYGLRIAADLSAACVRAGLVVVSGMARGIDAAAHRAAVDAGGQTIAVQGTGVDVPYPVSHRALHAVLAQRATVISEVEPGTAAFRGCFPRRNRLIAALSKVVVVVEADHKSGAINTATHALALNGTVAAVPGRVDVPQSAGTNQLLFDGAQMIREPADLLALLGISQTLIHPSSYPDTRFVESHGPEERVGEAFADYARRVLDADLIRSGTSPHSL